MKTSPIYIKPTLLLLFLFFVKAISGQGRVVINEYMPWTLNGCGATAEFVELMNFGPGPIDIGCYILTDGDFSVTIPPNTILLPGEFYVLAGQDIIPAPCANIDSMIVADLNWNTCGCTSDPIPTTGDGFFTDGGSANEQIVLFDPNLNVADAVVRDYPLEPSSHIFTSSVGGCVVQDFNLDIMSINYETLGMSTGRGNSFARKLDGDCGWVKDPQQSASATNNTPGEESDVIYLFSYINSMDCNSGGGSIHIFVRKADYTGFFPMKWSLAFDANNNGSFDFSDTYTYGSDSIPPDITITGLPIGRYRITVESAQGCSLKSFDFQILPCLPALPVQLIHFSYTGASAGYHQLEWELDEVEHLNKVILEKSLPERDFIQAETFLQTSASGLADYFYREPANSPYKFFRLKIINSDGSHFYSPVITINQESSYQMNKIWPNPTEGILHIQLSSAEVHATSYVIYNSYGAAVKKGAFRLSAGVNYLSISLEDLPPGIYYLQTKGRDAVSFSFVKS